MDYDQLLAACILATSHMQTAVLWQKGPLMWIHLSSSPKKVLTPYYEAVAVLIQNCRIESRKYFGKEPDEIFIPYSKQQLNWLLQNTDIWPIACANFLGKIDNHYPKDKLLQFASMHAFVFPVNLRMHPIENVLTVFTDGSSNGKAAYVIESQVHSLEFSPCFSTNNRTTCCGCCF